MSLNSQLKTFQEHSTSLGGMKHKILVTHKISYVYLFPGSRPAASCVLLLCESARSPSLAAQASWLLSLPGMLPWILGTGFLLPSSKSLLLHEAHADHPITYNRLSPH